MHLILTTQTFSRNSTAPDSYYTNFSRNCSAPDSFYTDFLTTQTFLLHPRRHPRRYSRRYPQRYSQHYSQRYSLLDIYYSQRYSVLATRNATRNSLLCNSTLQTPGKAYPAARLCMVSLRNDLAWTVVVLCRCVAPLETAFYLHKLFLATPLNLFLLHKLFSRNCSAPDSIYTNFFLQLLWT